MAAPTLPLADETVKDTHLLTISHFILNWEVVAVYLGLSEADREGIKQNHHGNHEMMKLHFLEIWRRRNGDEATYRCIIEKARAHHDEALAGKVEKLVGITHASVTPATSVTPAISEATGTTPEAPGTNRDVGAQVSDLQEGFSSLMEGLARNLVTERVTIDDIVLHIACRPPSKIKQHLDYILNEIPSMRSAVDIIQLIMKLRKYMMFLDHSLLKEIITRFATDDVKKKLESYEVDVQIFCRQTSIADFITCLEKDDEVKIPECFKELKIKQEINPAENTLSDLEVLRKACASKWRLIECAMIFMKSEPGCVCLTYAVPLYSVPNLRVTIRQRDNVEFYSKKGITVITLDSEEIYSKSDSSSSGSMHVESSSNTGSIVPAPPSPSPSNHSSPPTPRSSHSSPPSSHSSPPEQIVFNFMDLDESSSSPSLAPFINMKTNVDFEPRYFYMNSNGQYPSISMNNKGWILQVYIKENVIGLRLRCRVGYLDQRVIMWSNTRTVYSKGFYPRIAINNEGLVVAVFAAQVGRMMWYRVGKLEFKEEYDPDIVPSQEVVDSAFIQWRGSKMAIGEGRNPTVTLSNDKTVVMAYESGYVNLESRYHIGDLRGASIEWRSDGSKVLVHSQLTKHASVAINDKGQVAIGYSNGYERTIHYTVGQISSDSDDEIVMSDTKYTPPGANYQPVVSINNEGHVVAVFHSLQGRLSLKINHGIVKMDNLKQLPYIEWSVFKTHEFAANGYHASVAVNDRLDFVTSHKSLTLSIHKSIRNYVGHLTYDTIVA